MNLLGIFLTMFPTPTTDGSSTKVFFQKAIFLAIVAMHFMAYKVGYPSPSLYVYFYFVYYQDIRELHI
jgi:hypothetical protein